MKILVNGCSFSCGPISWPYHLPGLTNISGHNVVNLACAGAGNTYIHETTTRALYKDKFDLVLIMWSGIHRVDKQIEDHSSLNESTYTSRYQKSQNDWPEKIIHPFNDQTLVEDNWLFGCGHINKDSTVSAVFKNDYTYIGHQQFIDQFLVKVASLQNTIKQLGIPYRFSFYQNYIDQIKHSKMIDWTKCVLTDNINDIAKRLNSYDTDGIHPGLEANQQWAQCVVEHLNND